MSIKTPEYTRALFKNNNTIAFNALCYIYNKYSINCYICNKMLLFWYLRASVLMNEAV